MKRLNKKLALFLTAAMLTVTLFSGLTVTAFATSGSDLDFQYKEVDAGASVEIIGYNSNAAGGHVTIPASLGGMTVVGIADSAFKNNTKVQDVDMSGSPNMQYIGNYAFEGCTNLTSVEFNSALQTLGQEAFDGSGLTSVTIPSGIKEIYLDTFMNCSDLVSVTFAAGSDLTDIDDYSFYGTGITSINIPAGVDTIGVGAFASSPLKSVNLPASLATIGQKAFLDTKLTNITIPANVATIDHQAFNVSPNKTSTLKTVIFNDCDSVSIQTDSFNIAFLSAAANNCMFYGNPGSAAYSYAHPNNIPFNTLDYAVGTTSITAAESTGQNSLFITWSSAANANGYELYRGTSTSNMKIINSKSPSKTSYSDTGSDLSSGLLTGTVYYYKVRAYKNDSGTYYYGNYSDIKSATPALRAPSSISVNPSSPNGYNSLTITWSPVTGATGYKVYRSTSLYGAYTLLKSVVGVTSFMNTGLITNNPYYYKVCAYITATDPVTNKPTTTTTGELSASAWSVPKLAQVTGLSVQPTNASDALKLSWTTVLGRTGYEVQRADDEDFTDNVKTISVSNYIYTNSGLITGKDYYYRVRAYRVIGGVRKYGNYSLVVSGAPELHQVMGLTAKALSSTKIKLSWSAVSGRKGYIIYSYDPDSGDSEEIGRTTATYFYDSDLDPSTTYEYYVVAFKLVGTDEDEIDADPSVTVSVKTMAATS